MPHYVQARRRRAAQLKWAISPPTFAAKHRAVLGRRGIRRRGAASRRDAAPRCVAMPGVSRRRRRPRALVALVVPPRLPRSGLRPR